MSLVASASSVNAPEPFLFRHSTRQIIYAPGALASIGELVQSRRLRRGALVIDGFFRDTEVCERVRSLVEGNGAAFAVHAPPNQEPDTDSVEACRRFLSEFEPDCVFAIGGGSTMDTAKVARIMLSNPGDVAESAGFDREFLPHPSLFVCMPTTAGTGSEVSEMAVVSLAGSDIKLRYRSQNMTAEVAVLDPELTVTAPPPVTAACGFDALTHAVEGFVSRLASPMTDPYTIDAVRRLARWLPVAYEEPENIDARGQCLLASPPVPSTAPSSVSRMPSPRRSVRSITSLTGSRTPSLFRRSPRSTSLVWGRRACCWPRHLVRCPGNRRLRYRETRPRPSHRCVNGWPSTGGSTRS